MVEAIPDNNSPLLNFYWDLDIKNVHTHTHRTHKVSLKKQHFIVFTHLILTNAIEMFFFFFNHLNGQSASQETFLYEEKCLD